MVVAVLKGLALEQVLVRNGGCGRGGRKGSGQEMAVVVEGGERGQGNAHSIIIVITIVVTPSSFG